MAKEIERKYLVRDDSFKQLAVKCINIRQGYLSSNPEATVRIRITDDRAFLTIKSRNRGIVRDEWEYEIPVSDAQEMFGCCGDATLEKCRYIVPYEDETWEVDVFGGRLAGLVVAEIELPDKDAEVKLPQFIDKEVTGDPRFYNSNLCRSHKQ